MRCFDQVLVAVVAWVLLVVSLFWLAEVGLRTSASHRLGLLYELVVEVVRGDLGHELLVLEEVLDVAVLAV